MCPVPFELLAWYRNHALPNGEDLCFDLRTAGDPEVAAVEISDMFASGTTLSSDVAVQSLGDLFSDQEVRLMNQLMGLEEMILCDQDRSAGVIRQLFQSLLEKGAELALRHQAEGR